MSNFNLSTGNTRSIVNFRNEDGTIKRQYAVVNRGVGGLQWALCRVPKPGEEKLSVLANIKLHPIKGFSIAFAPMTEKQSEKFQKTLTDLGDILAKFADKYARSVGDLPTIHNPRETGSIIFAVLLRAIDKAGVDFETVGINKPASIALTEDDWKNSFLHFESQCEFPDRVREEFITVMRKAGIEISFKSEEVKTPDPATTEESSNSPDLITRIVNCGSKTKLKGFTLEELRQYCLESHLDASGTKKDLVTRIWATLDAFFNSSNATSDSTTTEVEAIAQ